MHGRPESTRGQLLTVALRACLVGACPYLVVESDRVLLGSTLLVAGFLCLFLIVGPFFLP